MLLPSRVIRQGASVLAQWHGVGASTATTVFSRTRTSLPEPSTDQDEETITPPPNQTSTAFPTPRESMDKAPKLLMREFIHQSLYHPTRGYFNRSTPVVGHLHDPINYWKIYCKDEWKMLVNKKYKELEVSFLTPVELFSPWYGYILARHIFEHRKHNLLQEGQPLVVYEVGGGNGTLARDILDWIRDNRPEDYQRTTYTCVEISTRLAAQQYDTVVTKGGHHGRFRMVQGNAWDRSTWGGRDYQHCFLLMMEVLDNLPHDRVARAGAGSPWRQTVVLPQAGSVMAEGPWREELEEVADPLLRRCLDVVYKPPTLEEKLDSRFNRLLDFILAKDPEPDAGGAEVLFVPTASLALMDTLHDARPNHSLIAADFDKLPDVKVPGKYAPLVSEKVGGQNFDHPSIFVPWGSADIFFPTDFDALGRLYRASAEHVWGEGTGRVNTAHYRQGAVMKRYKEMFKTATICAFNPMVDDFLNARFFFGDSYNRRDPALTAVQQAQQAAISAWEQQQRQLRHRQQQQEQQQKAAAAAPQGSGASRGPDASVLRPGPPPPQLPAWARNKFKQHQQQSGAKGDEGVLGGQKLKGSRAK